MTIGQRKGLKAARGARQPTTEFRTTMTSPEGLGKTDIFAGRVMNVDYKNFTVDVVSQFDQIRLLQIPVGAPYLHPNRGEGAYAMPEVGSKCFVCWPGDSSPPFVLCFIMPHETESDVSEDAPAGTEPKGDTNQGAVRASYAGGRPRAKGGDIVLRGRDGNHIVLHRGGVLQIGANELSQRVYVPLNNQIMDFAENYALHSSGGSVSWGIQEGEGEENLPNQFVQTFRVFANEQYADLRVAVGKVHNPAPDNDTGLTNAGVGKDSPIVFELALSRNGFRAEDGGLLPATGGNLKLRLAFDRDGNLGARFEGVLYARCKKKLVLNVDDSIEITGGAGLSVNITGDTSFKTSGTFEMSGAVVKINGGSTAVAKVGDNVVVTLPPGILMAAPTPTGFAPVPPPMSSVSGVIVGPGSSTVLVP